MLEFRDGTRKNDKQFTYSHELAHTKQQVGYCVVGTLWCTDEPRANMDSQNSPRPGLGGSYHLPPYNILCAWPRDQHPNVIMSWDSQVGISKFPKLRFLRLWGSIILCADLRLRWGLKQSCILCQELSNNMWPHTPCIFRNLSLGLATKVKACNGVSQKWSQGVTFHAPRSVGKCEGMNPILSNELPLWELESWWTSELSESNCKG
jgi:hypothetical protein